MDPVVFLITVVLVFGIPAFTVFQIARLRAARQASPSTDVTGRLETLEHDVQRLRQELTETEERLDFAERVLSQSREERRIGP